MDVLKFLEDKINLAVNGLRKLVDNYSHMEREPVIQRSSAVFDAIRSCIQIDNNLLYPRLRYHNRLEHRMDVARAHQAEMDAIMESSVMMHVDEPSDEYKDNLEALLRNLVAYQRIELDEILPQARQILTEADLDAIQKHLSAETKQETHPDELLKFAD